MQRKFSVDLESAREQYETLFNPERSTLKPRDVFDYQVERLKRFSLMIYRDADLLLKHIPKTDRNFIIAPLRTREMTISYLTRLIEVDGVKGFSYINNESIVEEPLRFPNIAYLMLDADDGTRTLGLDQLNAFKSLRKEGRMPYTIFPGLIHVILFPELLLRRNMLLSGSRRGADEVANVWLNEGRPELSWNVSDYSDAKWGSASAASIFVP